MDFFNNSHRRALLCVPCLLAGFILLFCTSSAISQGCNINQPVATSSLVVRLSLAEGQTFTPTCTGTLTRVTFESLVNVITVGTISIKTTDCNGTMLATASGINIGIGSNTVTFETPILVTANTTYYLEISVVPSITGIALARNSSNVSGIDEYTSGSNHFTPLPSLLDPTPTCTNVPSQDLVFSVTINAPLPVELRSFRATTEGGKNTLTWITASELNSKSFDIERSTDGVSFTNIGTLQAAGKAATYNYEDARPFSGINYYRLKQVDRDGKFEYSKVVTAQVGKGKSAIKIFPTTTAGVVQIDNDNGRIDNIAVFNATGQLVLTTKTTNRLDLTGMPTGIYFVWVQAEKETMLEKVFKK